MFVLFFLMSEIRLATLNVNGARDIRKRALLKEIIKQKNIDVIFCKKRTVMDKMPLNGKGSLKASLY